jgi:aquaporin Z
VLGEIVTTFALGTTSFVFLAFRHLRAYTPFVIPFLYAVMVPLEAAISGTSTNPARTFGPALISGRWDGWWIYWVGPMLGILALNARGLARTGAKTRTILSEQFDLWRGPSLVTQGN